jgi:hypothetical protein
LPADRHRAVVALDEPRALIFRTSWQKKKIAFHDELADLGVVQPFDLALMLGCAIAVAVLERTRCLIQELLLPGINLGWDEPDSAGPDAPSSPVPAMPPARSAASILRLVLVVIFRSVCCDGTALNPISQPAPNPGSHFMRVKVGHLPARCASDGAIFRPRRATIGQDGVFMDCTIDDLPDDAVVPRRVTAAVLHISQRISVHRPRGTRPRAGSRLMRSRRTERSERG